MPPDKPAAITAAGSAQHMLAINPPIVPCPINANLLFNLIFCTPIQSKSRQASQTQFRSLRQSDNPVSILFNRHDDGGRAGLRWVIDNNYSLDTLSV